MPMLRTRKPARKALPARFGNARDQPFGGKLTKCQAGNLKAANESSTASRDFATVYHPGWARIAWKLRETVVIFFPLQLGSQCRVFLRGCSLPVVAIYPGHFRHKGTRKVAKTLKNATCFSKAGGVVLKPFRMRITNQ